MAVFWAILIIAPLQNAHPKGAKLPPNSLISPIYGCPIFLLLPPLDVLHLNPLRKRLLNLDHAIEYRLIKSSAFVPADRHQKQIEVAERIVLHGVDPLRKNPVAIAPETQRELLLSRSGMSISNFNQIHRIRLPWLIEEPELGVQILREHVLSQMNRHILLSNPAKPAACRLRMPL